MFNYTTKEMVSKVWEFVQNIPTIENNIAIAGGMIADAYFNKPFTDIDVFVAAQDQDRLVKFCDYYGFKEFGVPESFRTEFDSYGNAHKVRIGKQESDILAVYKGQFLGHSIDFVLVNTISVIHHIETQFDQSIKSCWFNGEYNYSDYFKMSIDMNEVFPIRQEAGAYARAWLSANKYGLGLSNNYELSKHYTAYAYERGEVEGILSEATINKIENVTDKMFNFEIDMANVILMDVFLQHMPDNDEVYNHLTKVAVEDVITNHELHGQELSIGLTDPNHMQFKSNIAQMQASISPLFDTITPEQQAAMDDLSILVKVTPDQFAKGILIDDNGREARIGRFLNKVARKHKEVFAANHVTYLVEESLKLIEKRGAASKAKVFITGSRYALTHISTDTEWTTSCQRWGGFQSCTRQNYGLIGNVCGTTLVAYIADERNDYDSSKWKARFLIRIGNDNTLYLERAYTGRIEYLDSRQSVQSALNALGYNTFITQKESLDFRGLPMWAKPYNDNATDMILKKTKSGMYFFKGNREQYEKDIKRKAAQAIVDEFVQTIDVRALNYTPGHYDVMVARVYFPAEHNELVREMWNTSHLGVQRAFDHMALHVDDHDGKACIKVTIYAGSWSMVTEAKGEAVKAGIELNFPEYDMWGNPTTIGPFTRTDSIMSVNSEDDLPF